MCLNEHIAENNTDESIMKITNYNNIDKVIKRYYDYLPYGADFSDTTYDLIETPDEIVEIKNILVDYSIIDYWGNYNKFILSKIGESVINKHGGFEKYLLYLDKENKEKEKLYKIENDKLLLDAKLSRWQVKVFWYVFILGLIGGIYTIYSILNSAFGESQEQKIENILESKLKELQQADKNSDLILESDSLNSN